jgi:hypothetical protein
MPPRPPAAGTPEGMNAAASLPKDTNCARGALPQAITVPGPAQRVPNGAQRQDIRCDLVVKLLGQILLSGGDGRRGRRECGVLVVVLAGGQAVVQAAEQPSEQVALGRGVPVSVFPAPVIVISGAG